MNLKNVMGVINLRDYSFLRGITENRPAAAVPFGGRYRLIDFILSSMVNSGIKNIGIFIKDKSRSLIDHLRAGKDWDLDRKKDGLFIFHCDNVEHDAKNAFLRELYENLDYLHKSKQEYAVISDGNVACNLDLEPILSYHIKIGADITVVYKERDVLDVNTGTVIAELTEDNRVTDILDIEEGFSKMGRLIPEKLNKVSMNIYIISKQLLIDITCACIARGHYDFVKDGLIKNLSKLKIYGYCYRGYAAIIDSIKSYYKYNLELLDQNIWRRLFFENGLIYTKVKDGPPAKYMKNASADHSLIANACIIDGIVKNSILFRRVRVHKGALIKNSIIMQKTEIGQNVVIENAILDKEVKVTKGKKLIGSMNHPLVIGKRTII